MTVTLALPPEAEEALKAAAQAQGVSADEWLRQIVQDQLQNIHQPEKRAQFEPGISETESISPSLAKLYVLVNAVSTGWPSGPASLSR